MSNKKITENIVIKYPEIAKEWHPTKNGDLAPEMFTIGSHKKVWWFLPYDDSNTGKHFDFEWQATIRDRGRSSSCPFITGKAVWKGFNDLSTTHPKLAKEWHPTKNGDLTPEMITASSAKKVWWFLPYDDPNTGKHFDFEWQASISSRCNGTNCPYLKNKATWPGFNDLATTNPEIAKEWHPNKNGDLTPSMVTAGSGINAWWYVPYDDPNTGKHFDFEWQARISHRSNDIGCPFLVNKAVWPGFNDLATSNPELAKEWHPTKNGDLTPEMITAGSAKKVWWFLPYDDPNTGKHFDFEWQAIIRLRVSGESKCPYLSGYLVYEGFNDLATTNPELIKEWHPTKNGNLKPTMVTRGSDQKVWWYLPYDDPNTGKHFNFEWQAMISNRATKNYGCPFLAASSGTQVWQGFNDLSTTHPKLAKEWHPTKNGDLTPEMITAGSAKKVWWFIKYSDPIINDILEYEWKAVVSKRTIENTGCPYLSGSSGERYIYSLLRRWKIDYEIEKRLFKNYRFDVFIPKLKVVIEYDGIQHFNADNNSLFIDSYEQTQQNDICKNEYCLHNNIPILRIPYIYDTITHKKKIQDFIRTFLQSKKVPCEIIYFYEKFPSNNYLSIAKELNAKHL